MNEIKCKERGCLLEANKSGYCDRHDPDVRTTKSNGIANILHTVGMVIIIIGAVAAVLSIISFSLAGIFSSIGIAVSGVIVMGFAEIITLLQKLVNRST